VDVLLGKLTGIRRAEGRADQPMEIHVISVDAYTVDGVKRLENAASRCDRRFRLPYILGPDPEPLADKIAHLERYAERIITKVNP